VAYPGSKRYLAANAMLGPAMSVAIAVPPEPRLELSPVVMSNNYDGASTGRAPSATTDTGIASNSIICAS
jgi:hypothetical protein